MAPPTFTVTGVPLQTVVFVTEAVTVGAAVTVTVIVLPDVQLPLVPVTV